MNELISRVRQALRIKTEAFDDEIADLIDACRIDLNVAGATMYDVNDPLCIQATVLYCKAYFGFSEESDKYIVRYEALRAAMANSSDYRQETKE